MVKTYIGFEEALALIEANISIAPSEEVVLVDLVDRVLAENVRAMVDSPSVNASLKDGYAVHSEDLTWASPENPVFLTLFGLSFAGSSPSDPLPSGMAVRVTTGAELPPGADAVLAGEFAEETGEGIRCIRDAGPGRNVLEKGTDVKAGRIVAARGEILRPAMVGLLAAAGLDRARVTVRPRIALLATGDEVVAPGLPLTSGKLYASNMVETSAWLKSFGFPDPIIRILPDRAEEIGAAISELRSGVDAFISSGGAWGSERDLMLDLLESLGWRGFFHRVRLGPGKAAGFGLLGKKPFFILPGGPPSHEAAFLLLALPGLMAMSGRPGPVFEKRQARLTEALEGQSDWTQCVHVLLTEEAGLLSAEPLKWKSRLSAMARKDGLLLLPEGVEGYRTGETVEILKLD